MAPTGDIARFRAPAFPVFVWEDVSGTQIYGFPAYGADAVGVKVAFCRNGTPADPDALDRVVHADEIEQMGSYLASRIPELAERCLRGLARMYTTTPDQHFVLATIPTTRR
jgi:sarcosine oxidase